MPKISANAVLIRHKNKNSSKFIKIYVVYKLIY